ncbi:helix-turn-helix domain-containing protein [Aestuariibaculum marinum]|uniref:Helix-turn-helix domain-containing protein n=1 Tax=Aestuariibaculum marinum TaxID=2683592 RepID=A0A8J6Q547_9FLAO|nr:helix-turn-helix domain-containing protein [Aestuariibaculum marinum]MBD0824454.1 helix-turn-helix domain-containing protein [Aestuariibaculum marinum]
MENPFEIILERLDRIETLLLKIQEPQREADTKRVMNMNSLSEYLGISKHTLYRLTSTREIPHSKRGNRILFDKQLIDEWALGQRIKTREELEEEVNAYLFKNRIK